AGRELRGDRLAGRPWVASRPHEAGSARRPLRAGVADAASRTLRPCGAGRPCRPLRAGVALRAAGADEAVATGGAALALQGVQRSLRQVSPCDRAVLDVRAGD